MPTAVSLASHTVLQLQPGMKCFGGFLPGVGGCAWLAAGGKEPGGGGTEGPAELH